LKNFGIIHAQLGENHKAAPFLNKAAKLLTSIKVQSKVPLIYEEIATTFTKMGNFESALKYQKAFSTSQQTLFDQDKATAMLELTTRYESETEAEEHKQQIATLEKDKANSLKWKIFLLAVIGLIAGLLASLFVSYQRKKKANTVLKDKNED